MGGETGGPDARSAWKGGRLAASVRRPRGSYVANMTQQTQRRALGDTEGPRGQRSERQRGGTRAGRRGQRQAGGGGGIPHWLGVCPEVSREKGDSESVFHWVSGSNRCPKRWGVRFRSVNTKKFYRDTESFKNKCSPVVAAQRNISARHSKLGLHMARGRRGVLQGPGEIQALPRHVLERRHGVHTPQKIRPRKWPWVRCFWHGIGRLPGTFWPMPQLCALVHVRVAHTPSLR